MHPREDLCSMETSKKLVEFCNQAVEDSGDANLHFLEIRVELSLEADFGTMMHWSESGQRKIAIEMARCIRRVWLR